MNTELKVASPLNGLARRLVSNGVLDEAQAEKACMEANKKNSSLLSYLLKEKLAEPLALAEGEKCERCWKVLPDVGSNPDVPGVCGRCAEAVQTCRHAA